MGSLRLMLAYLVVVTHTGAHLLGFNVGTSAVVIFMLLSGMVMTGLITKHYPDIADVPAFYADRAMRLLPHLYLYLTLSFILCFAFEMRGYWGTSLPDGLHVLYHYLVLPMEFYSENTSPMAQEWSLGLEGFFYLLIPFLVAYRLREAAAILSFFLFVGAILCGLDVSCWCFKYLTGTLFIFACGSLLAAPERTWSKDLVAALWFATLVLFAASYYDASMPGLVVARQVLVGVVIGIPLLTFVPLRAATGRDAYLGNLSYGVFLSHWIVIAMIERLTGHLPHGWIEAVPVCALATALSASSYAFVEKPVIALRRHLRKGPLARGNETIVPEAEAIVA